jgi:hypothetical protein
MPYPVSCLLLISPLSNFTWDIVKLAWGAVCVALFVAGTFELIQVAELSWRRYSSWLLLAAILGFYPILSGLSNGQIAVAAVMLTIMCVRRAALGLDDQAGVLLAVGIALKPQISLFFLLHYFVRRKWRLLAFAAGSISAIWLLAIVRLANCAPGFLLDWLRSVKNYSAIYVEGFRSATTGYQLLDLGTLIAPLTGNAFLNQAITASILIPLFLLYGLSLYRAPRTVSTELLYLSILVPLILLSPGHRFYDAALLVIPLAWCLSAKEGFTKLEAKLLLCLLLPFFIPGGAIAGYLVDSSRVPGDISTSWWWTMFVGHHHIWLLCLMELVLLRRLFCRVLADGRD